MRLSQYAVLGFFFTTFILARPAPAQGTKKESARTPVLVELFTSEGCSSCPPADRLLQKLDQSQPIQNAEAVVLSEHVDYWDHDGWRDPFSGSFFTQRQHQYGSRFGLDDVYTPQMVVNGKAQFVGNDSARAIQAIAEAARAQTISVGISNAMFGNGVLKFRVDAVAPASGKPAELYVVLALDRASSHVSAGENSGRELTHVSVARQFTTLGMIAPGPVFVKDVEFKLSKDWTPGNIRVIAFLQEPGQGAVLGVAVQRVTK